MTLNDLIKRGRDISYQLSSGDIPIVMNGLKVENIKLDLRRDNDARPYVEMTIRTGNSMGLQKERKNNYSLRARMLDMEPGESITIPLSKYRSVTVYNYVSTINRDYEREYFAKYDRDTRTFTVIRES